MPKKTPQGSSWVRPECTILVNLLQVRVPETMRDMDTQPDTKGHFVTLGNFEDAKHWHSQHLRTN